MSYVTSTGVPPLFPFYRRPDSCFTKVAQVVPETFHYRRSRCTCEETEQFLHIAMGTFNRTPWKCHAPETVRLMDCNWTRDGDSDTGELISRFHIVLPESRHFRIESSRGIRYVPVYETADFNEFDFGVLAAGAE